MERGNSHRFSYRRFLCARNHAYQLDSDSWTIFAQGTFNLTDNWRLTLVLRYTEENKDAKSKQFPADDITGLDVPSDEYWLGQIQATAFDTYRYDFKDDGNTDQWVPSVNVQWDIKDSNMLYASYSESFKRAGFTGADDGMELFAGGEANYSDDYDTQGDLDAYDVADDCTKINLRFGVRGANEDWEVMVCGRNITDEEVAAYGFDVPVLSGSHADMYDEGQVFGARARYSF